MNIRARTWLISALVYAAFVSWYTDFGGPLDAAEVDAFVATLDERNTDPALVQSFEQFLRNDTGRQFLVVNALDMTDNPPDVEGASPGENAKQLMARYSGAIFPAMLKRASHPVLLGDAVHTVLDVLGVDGAEQWTDAVLIRYRSRRTFMEIITEPGIGDTHRFKLAALDKTIAFPVEPRLYLGDLRLLLGLILLAIIALLDSLVLSRRN